MKNYEVTICATITKTLSISAESEQAAAEQAHEQFDATHDGGSENYSEKVVACIVAEFSNPVLHSDNLK